MKRHNGFTLIELLVVIAIITLLAAILFPVFASAQEKARQSACTSNLKQLGLAFIQYEQDYDEYMPCAFTTTNLCYPAGEAVCGFGWPGRIYPYVKSTSVFTCPDDDSVGIASTVAISYALAESNTYYAGVNGVGGALAKYTAPSKTVLLYEVQSTSTYPDTGDPTSPLTYSGWVGWGLGSPYNPIYGYVAPATYRGLNYNLATGYLSCPACSPFAAPTLPPNNDARHTGGAYYLMADGHVKFLLPGNVSCGIYAQSKPTDAASTLYAEGTQNGTHAVTWSTL